VCGLGAGIVDRLIEMGDNVLGIDNAARSEGPEKFFNLRLEIWCKAGDAYADEYEDEPYGRDYSAMAM